MLIMSYEFLRERSFGFLLHDVARLMGKRYDRRVRRLELTRAQCRVLFHVAREEGLNQACLADRLDIEPITLTRLIDRMEAAGWIERRSDPGDRRAKTLFLTARAWPILDVSWDVAKDVREESLTGLSDDERATLMSLLTRVHENLSRPDAATGAEASTDTE
jgi:DNA-binding MarR family transcriptional regulator